MRQSNSSWFNKENEMTLKGADAQREAEAIFEFENADLLLSYDRDVLRPALAGWMRLEGIKRVNFATDEPEDYLVVLEQGIADLISRGALTPCRPLSKMGQQQLDSLSNRYKVTPASEKPVVVPVDPFEEVVRDHNELPAAELKKKIFADPAYAALYETACTNGRIRSYVR
jgi:hypothetical protein